MNILGYFLINSGMTSLFLTHVLYSRHYSIKRVVSKHATLPADARSKYLADNSALRRALVGADAFYIILIVAGLLILQIPQ